MKESRVIYATKRAVRGDVNRTYNLYSSRVVRIERDYIESNNRSRRRNVSCQCNAKELICTCRKLAAQEARYFTSPKHVYRFTDWRSFTDIGVGSVKALPRKRIRRIYLPETVDRGIGSTDLTPLINRRNRQRCDGSYYDSKRTSSKCVGGFMENDNVSLMSKKLSPIIQKKSGATSPKTLNFGDQHKNFGSYNIHRHTTTTPTQVNTNELYPKQQKSPVNNKTTTNQTSTTLQAEVTKDVLPTTADKLKPPVVSNNPETGKDYSSDSLVQHVHNLENPSDEKHSKMSVDPMENKLEREYRKIFSTKSKDKPSSDKPMPDFKSASLLRRRFEALRRGLGKKDSKKDSLLINEQGTSSQVEVPCRKDVSIASDPPSLEGRSYSNTKIYSPSPSVTNNYRTLPKIAHKKSSRGKKKKYSSQWSPSELADSKYEGVQGMFKLWGKRFNLEEDYYAKTSPTISDDVKRKVVRELEDKNKSQSPTQEVQKKKPGKKFFFFGKKNKDRETKPFKPKKGVTTGRCELKDGLMIKVGGTNEYPVKEPVKSVDKQPDYEGMLRKAWVDKFVTNARESRNSVQIRWDNKMYGTSSSTVLELMDSVYKHTGIDLRSRSEITTGESSNYRSFTKQRVHFVQQDIEAWMIPKTITDKQRQIENFRYKTNLMNDGYSQKIELVLHAKPHNKKSEYIIINIPDGYFSQSSSNDTQTQSSDEKIYKIVEYETPDLKKIKENRHMATGDFVPNNIEATDTAKNPAQGKNEDKQEVNEISGLVVTNPSLHRDVAIQGSNVFVPLRCDVIEVGIITQRDIRDVRKPILKIQDEITDDDSEQNVLIQKKCELAESYLQDYYRNWPLGIDMFSWCISDSQLRPSDNSSPSLHNQGDGSKSCTNIYEDFQGSTIVSSCETSSCSHCIALEDEKRQEDSLKCKLFNKFKKKSISEGPISAEKRVHPKDSVEVCKKRQMYACSNKSKWKSGEDSDPHSSASNERIGQGADCPQTKPCWKLPDKKKRLRKKHVSLPGCDAMSKITSRLADESPEGILSFKGSSKCNLCKKNSLPKRTEVVPKPVCEIPQPPCKESCMKEKKPACNKKNSPPCDPPDNSYYSPPPRVPRSADQSTPISPPTWSPSDSPPKCVKPRSKPKSPPTCHTPPCKKATSTCSGCHTPPCKNSASAKQRQYPNEEYPWPLKNQISQQPSKQSGLSLKMSPSPSPKNSDKCITKRPPSPKASKEKGCKPDCANRPRTPNLQTPPTPPPTAYHMPESQSQSECAPDCANRQKVSGLHLKKLPSKKKTCTDECLAWGSDGPGVIRLNSKENITIRTKKETPSTEEIRESCNIKVRDEDGRTLYERIDYRKSGEGNKCTLIKDMYKDSQIHRVSTPTTVHKVVTQDKIRHEVHDGKSATSLDHLIEINFTLKLKQGDKGTEVNIKNAGDNEVDKQNKETRINESQKDIYIVQDKADPTPDDGAKNDVNIKIVIKNYKTDHKSNETETYTLHKTGNDNFVKRISEKFQTVSTGYSDVIDHHTFSVHRATVDLTTSAEKAKSQSKPSGEIVSEQLTTDDQKLATSSHSLIERSATEQTVNSTKYEENSNPSIKNSRTKNGGHSTEVSLNETDEFDGYKSEKESRKKENKKYSAETADETSNESFFHKKLRLRSKTRKKQMLKKIFESSSAVKKTENKSKIKEMLRAILTSESSGNEMVVTSNELTKELTYGSLDPGYFKETDSMSNYYEIDSDLSLHKKMARRKLNPSKNDSECSGIESEVSTDANKHGCLCSAFANKLNINNGIAGGCCCRRTAQTDKEIGCDVRTDDYCLVKTCIDVETQNSKQMTSKMNNANLSVQSKTQSIVITNASLKIRKEKKGDDDIKNKSIVLNDNICAGMANRNFVTGLSSDEIVVFNSNLVRKPKTKAKDRHKHRDYESKRIADILQLNETKKAVLEIYAEKIVSNEGERIVAKLPKFDYKKDLDISNYEEVVTGCKRVGKRNLLMMSINR